MDDSLRGAIDDVVAQLLSEIERGGGLSLGAVGRLLPAHRGGGTVGPSTALRWIRQGVKAGDGRVVKLAAARAGSRWLTSRQAVARYLADLTAAASGPAPDAPTRTPAARTRASERAAAELVKLGA